MTDRCPKGPHACEEPTWHEWHDDRKEDEMIEWDVQIAHDEVCDREPAHEFDDCPDEHYEVPAYVLMAVMVQLEDLAPLEQAAVLVQAMIELMERTPRIIPDGDSNVDA